MKTIDDASDSAHDVIDKITDASNQAADAVTKKGKQIKTLEQRLVNDCCDYTRKNPEMALAMAVAGGFLLSRVLSGR
ncbi:DUF883 domain-containing protein [Crenothrix sp.]|uniref:DUF883 domain-containing protein n=1 Tax=Crenothrix sp. TaxID=3100433 RepID=UPI00374DEF58